MNRHNFKAKPRFLHLQMSSAKIGNFLLSALFVISYFAHPSAKVGELAPDFTLKTQDGAEFQLSSRKGKGWTVLYFYPKADTPGCTTQACAFRDAINEITKLNTSLIGISMNSVEEQAQFHKKHRLNFLLLADAEGRVTKLFGAKMPLLSMSRRWTYVMDTELVIRHIEKDVDPAMDAKRVAEIIKSLQAK